MRSFEIARKMVNGEPIKYETDRCQTDTYEPAYPEAQIPEYQTTYSAGADFFCAEEVTIPSMWRNLISKVFYKADMITLNTDDKKLFQPTFVHTGIKANMNEDEVLELYNRSSNPKKLGLVLANSVGVVDADYYENKDNDGEIMFAFYNFMPFDVTLKVGDRIGQGVFKKYLRPEEGLRVKNQIREGGVGSTNKE